MPHCNFFLPGCSIGYEKEANAVYYKSWNEGSGSTKYPVDADPQTFQVFKDDNYAKDKEKAFYKGDIIKEADAATFETLGEEYARDKNHGYYQKDPVISSKGQTLMRQRLRLRVSWNVMINGVVSTHTTDEKIAAKTNRRNKDKEKYCRCKNSDMLI